MGIGNRISRAKQINFNTSSGLFRGKSKNSKDAENIHIDSTKNAKSSIKYLNSEWKNADHEGMHGHDRKVALVREANLAANRAQAELERDNISSSERKEFSKVASMYADWVEEHKGSYGDE